MCERHGIRPTWLTNWEMANDPAFVAFGRDVLARDVGEIGMHLHAWNSPPIMPLTADDDRHHPYLIEYPDELLREKVAVMTEILESTFGTKMVSHRAGRFGFDERYAKALIDQGDLVNGSVTPSVSWRGYKGDPTGAGGTDFSRFPERAYFVDPAEISRPGDSPLAGGAGDGDKAVGVACGGDGAASTAECSARAKVGESADAAAGVVVSGRGTTIGGYRDCYTGVARAAGVCGVDDPPRRS